MFNFGCLSLRRWFQFNSRKVRKRFASTMSLNNWEIIAETRGYIFRWRSRCRRGRVCLSSLISKADVEEREKSENITSRFCNNFSIIPSNYACKLCSKYPGIKLESAPQRYEEKIENLSSRYPQNWKNRWFHVVERMTTSSKCSKMKNARAKRAKLLFFIVKYANLWRSCCWRRRGCLS